MSGLKRKHVVFDESADVSGGYENGEADTNVQGDNAEWSATPAGPGAIHPSRAGQVVGAHVAVAKKPKV